MYYTPMGGDIMFVEASTMAGKGNLVLTGQLGDVMKESAQAAWTYAKANADELFIDPRDFQQDVHIHVPAGAIPKDGPSAGVAMVSALASLLTERPCRPDVAMTGEITLRGLVLPIGGIKEKTLAAHRAGIRTIIMPERNRRELQDIHEDVQEVMTFVFVKTVDEVLQHAIAEAPAEAPSVEPVST